MKTDEITIKTIDRSQRTTAIVEGELKSKRTLEKARDEWLNKPDNRLKPTYDIVAKDTAKIRLEIAELEQELKSLNK